MTDTKPERVYGLRDAARFLGLSVQGVRLLEAKRTFPAPTRTKGSHRRYSRDDLALMAACLDKARRVSIAEHPELAPMWRAMFDRSKVMAAIAAKDQAKAEATAA